MVGGAGHTGAGAGGQISGSGARATSTGAAAGAGGGEAAQPASHTAHVAHAATAIGDNGRKRLPIGEKSVGWVFLEIVAALAIAVAIVWWTIPKKSRTVFESEKRKDEGGS